MITGLEVVVTLSYGLFILAIVNPHEALLSAGLTLENVFHKFLGNEEIDFFHYHLRRTALVRCVFGILPLGKFNTRLLNHERTVFDLKCWSF